MEPIPRSPFAPARTPPQPSCLPALTLGVIALIPLSFILVPANVAFAFSAVAVVVLLSGTNCCKDSRLHFVVNLSDLALGCLRALTNSDQNRGTATRSSFPNYGHEASAPYGTAIGRGLSGAPTRQHSSSLHTDGSLHFRAQQDPDTV